MTTVGFYDYAFDEETCQKIIKNLSYLPYKIEYVRSGISCMLEVTSNRKMKKKELRDSFIMELMLFVARPEGLCQ